MLCFSVQVDDYKPWLTIPPENDNEKTDEILTHNDKLLLNLEGENEEDMVWYQSYLHLNKLVVLQISCG